MRYGWLAWRRWFTRSARRPGRRAAAVRPAVERLEGRTLPATFTVVNTDDGGLGSLRQAMLDANANSGADLIAFAIPGSGVHTLNVGSAGGQPLPTITDPVTIDGTTQPGYAGSPLIELNGAAESPEANGLFITVGHCTVRGLVINRFTSDGIELSEGGDNLIEGNYIGTDPSGTIALGNHGVGVVIFYGAGNTVGGTAAGAGNLISGNVRGVEIFAPGATGNLVEGNFIGTDVTGTVALGNAEDGVFISHQPGNTVGGTATGARNLISGNHHDGVLIAGATATGNLVQGNYIGTDVTGSVALGNANRGVEVINSASGNTVGGTTAAAANLIAGNHGEGVLLSSGATANLVEGNQVGTDATGTQGLGNYFDGVLITNASGNTIGGSQTGAGNLIAANGGNGIALSGSGATGNVLGGNLIGTDASGSNPLENAGAGVALATAAHNTIGGTAGAANRIAFNGGAGVAITGSAAIGNRINGDAIFSNTGLGIDLNNDGVTPNDVGDGDTGPNRLQNFPVLTTVTSTATSTTIQGTLNSRAGTKFLLQFFASAAADPSGFGEGQTFLGAASIKTGAGGNASFKITLSTPLPAGQSVVTATATDPSGNTSEFSAAKLAGTGSPSAAAPAPRGPEPAAVARAGLLVPQGPDRVDVQEPAGGPPATPGVAGAVGTESARVGRSAYTTYGGREAGNAPADTLYRRQEMEETAMAEFTLVLNERERQELLLLLETSLKETRVEVHRTHTPGYRENVQQEESLLRGLLEKVRKGGA
jgi:hypothetical protein